MPDKDTTVTVPIPAGDHNPEVAVLEKQSRFEDLPATQTPLRASNTVESLKPREVGPTPEQAIAAAVDLLPLGLDPFKTYDPVRKTDVDYSPKYDGPANILSVNWPEAQATPAGEKIFRPSNLGEFPSKIAAPVAPVKKVAPKAFPPSIESRIDSLEEHLSALLDRIAAYNVKSSHKI